MFLLVFSCSTIGQLLYLGEITVPTSNETVPSWQV